MGWVQACRWVVLSLAAQWGGASGRASNWWSFSQIIFVNILGISYSGELTAQWGGGWWGCTVHY